MDDLETFYANIPRHLTGPRPNNIGNALIVPGLKHCDVYRRNTGWFRQSALSVYVPAMENFLNNNGKIKMLASLTGRVNSDVLKALEKTKDENLKKKILLNHADTTLNKELPFLKSDPDNWTYQNHLLLYLIASNKLKIRYAISWPYEGAEPQLFHEKCGYFKFPNDEKLSFIGNFNESKGSILSHGERVQVSTSRYTMIPDGSNEKSITHDDKYDIDYYVRELDKQWKGEQEATEIFDINDETLERIKEYSLSKEELLSRKKEEEEKRKRLVNRPLDRNVPRIPSSYNGSDFILRRHQKNALSEWKKNGYKGIFEHATGSGKTVTAICGACDLAKYEKKVLIICVPYQSLADQWVDELENFNIFATRCYETSLNWKDKAPQELSKWRTKKLTESYMAAYVVVNKTLSSDSFQSFLSKIKLDNMIVIGDECHRYASVGGTEPLPDSEYRLGLSATPFRENDDYGTPELIKYFGNKVEPSYTLHDALNDNPPVLTPYDYLPVSVYLNYEEFEEFESKSRLAGANFNLDDDGRISQAALSAIGAMNRIKGSANDKFIKLEKLIPKIDKTNQVLFFCGDGSTEDDDSLNEESFRDIERVSKLVSEQNWIGSHFTHKEKSKERKEILRNFKDGSIDALISIRVLDEGIDIPGVGIAVLMASSRNPRQYVQRRGRILRKSPNKNKALIYDFICMPPKEKASEKASISLILSEVERILEMMQDSSNINISRSYLKNLLQEYTISQSDVNEFNEKTFNQLQKVIND